MSRFVLGGTWECDWCGARLRVRYNSWTGEYFLSCSSYPDCRFTRNPEELNLDAEEIFALYYISPMERAKMARENEIPIPEEPEENSKLRIALIRFEQRMKQRKYA